MASGLTNRPLTTCETRRLTKSGGYHYFSRGCWSAAAATGHIGLEWTRECSSNERVEFVVILLQEVGSQCVGSTINPSINPTFLACMWEFSAVLFFFYSRPGSLHSLFFRDVVTASMQACKHCHCYKDCAPYSMAVAVDRSHAILYCNMWSSVCRTGRQSTTRQHAWHGLIYNCNVVQ